MRRVSTFTRAVFLSPAIGLALAATLPAAPQTPPSRPPTPPASQPASQPTSAALYTQGCACLRAGDAAAAIDLLAQAVAKRPDKLEYSLKLAEAYALDQNWAAVSERLSPLEDKLNPDGLLLLASAQAETGHPDRASAILRRALERLPDSETLWLALIDRTLDQEQCGLALQRIKQAQRRLGPSPPLQFRVAQAYYRQGKVLGRTSVLRVPNGRAGQFVNQWLLVQKRDEPDRFLCCPKASALYALRRALDAGLDEPAAHCLHARIWQRAGRPEVGLAILRSREAILLESASPEILETFADLALAANQLNDFLRYVRLRAARQPQQRTDILYRAYLAAAERYNQRGDDAMYRELLRRALALRPENAALMLQLADTVWNAGARQEAVFWYRRVLEREPDHQDRSRILRRLED